jgi:BirA family transcriptional regulator, biotin operon repressor / biotin---[acetyl-CoA-carboxylase] ligase
MDLETRQLQQKLSQIGQCPEVIVLKPITTSTNDDVRELARKGLKQVLVSSRIQTQGRGQRQREWVSPAGNVYLSTLLNLQKPVDGRLALEVALNILQMPCLQHLSLQVKWPNDLYSLQGKWGGILVEPISTQQVIVGVGINLNPVETALDQDVTDLRHLGLATHISTQDIRAELYHAIQTAGDWFNYNSHNLAARFNHYAAFIQQYVEFEDLKAMYQGIFLGIADDGAVKIKTTVGEQIFYQGRLRLKQL